MAFASVSRCHVGRRRRLNEDAVLCRPDLGLWAVADGMGGHACGEVASALVVQLLARCPAGPDLPAKVAAIRRAIDEANARLLAMGRSASEPSTIGTTVVALASDGAAFSCLWAGDSRAYRRRDGMLDQLTRDHSLVQMLVDTGQIAATEAAGHPNANIVTRAVGTHPDPELDSVEGEVQVGDIFLLASDGLTRVVTDGELSVELDHDDLDAAADALIELTLARGAPDNVSLVILRAAGG